MNTFKDNEEKLSNSLENLIIEYIPNSQYKKKRKIIKKANANV
jgi:hypothetical protein